MRKQYHLRSSDRGILAWDVDRLVALTQGFPQEQVSLTAIRELDESFWFGYGATPTCRAVVDHARLIEETDLSHPIILSSDGRVMDGMHRVGKAILQGRSTIDAVRFTSDPDPDYTGVHPDDLPYGEGWEEPHPAVTICFSPGKELAWKDSHPSRPLASTSTHIPLARV